MMYKERKGGESVPQQFDLIMYIKNNTRRVKGYNTILILLRLKKFRYNYTVYWWEWGYKYIDRNYDGERLKMFLRWCIDKFLGIETRCYVCNHSCYLILITIHVYIELKIKLEKQYKSYILSLIQ